MKRHNRPFTNILEMTTTVALNNKPKGPFKTISKLYKPKFLFIIVFFLLSVFSKAQTNPNHVRVNGYYRSNGTYVQPYFRTAPNSTNRDNFSTKGNVNPYTGKPGWIEPDNNYNTFYYNTYSYTPNKTTNTTVTQSPQLKFRDRTYIEDENGNYSSYLKARDKTTFDIYDMQDKRILYLTINHNGDWRIFNTNDVYVKTIFVAHDNTFSSSKITYESPVGFALDFDKTWKRLPKEVLQQKIKDIKEFLDYRSDIQFDACYQKIGNANMDYPYILFKNIYATTTDEDQIKKVQEFFTNKSVMDKAIQTLNTSTLDIDLTIDANYYDKQNKILIFTYDLGINIKGNLVCLNAFYIGKSASLQISCYSYKDEFKYDQKDFLDIIYSIRDKGMKTEMRAYLDSHDLAVKYYNDAKTQSAAGNRAEAIKLYTKAIENYPTEDSYLKSEAYFNRGLNKRYLNDLTGAISDYTEAIKLRPDYYKAYNNRGYARLLLEEYQLAINDFTQTIKYDNYNTEFTNMALGNRGIAKFAIGQNGCDDLKKAIDNGNVNVVSAYNQYCK
jgi:tetratricopeptide (TPR) repeat protein